MPQSSNNALCNPIICPSLSCPIKTKYSHNAIGILVEPKIHSAVRPSQSTHLTNVCRRKNTS